MENNDLDATCSAKDSSFLVSRRRFLLGTGATLVMLTLPGWMRPGGVAQAQAHIAEYPRRRIGSLSELELGRAVLFNYPWEHANAQNTLIKLGQRAGGGIGPDEDVVAFNNFCTHQGAPMTGTFKADVGVAGPCPLHWTTFDLTKHGMVVSGHATMGLPQILLELDGDDIVATGVMGLVFGYFNNRVDPASLGG